MARLDSALDDLRERWDAIDPGTRAAAGEMFAAGASLFADGLRTLGPAVVELQRPAVTAFICGVQDVFAWGRSADWLGGRIESRFPLLVAYLKALMPETITGKPPLVPPSGGDGR